MIEIFLKNPLNNRPLFLSIYLGGYMYASALRHSFSFFTFASSEVFDGSFNKRASPTGHTAM